MKYVIIDNNDSFTFNLFHLIKKANSNIILDVVNNQLSNIEMLDIYDGIILSPGPGLPHEAGKLLDIIDKYKATKKILGVCLGHQAIGYYFGANLIQLENILHGVQSSINILPLENNVCDEIFTNLYTSNNRVGRYHSWAIDKSHLPECLEIAAVSDDNVIMAIRHKVYNIRGVQFHPESILTPNGINMIANWINI